MTIFHTLSQNLASTGTVRRLSSGRMIRIVPLAILICFGITHWGCKKRETVEAKQGAPANTPPNAPAPAPPRAAAKVPPRIAKLKRQIDDLVDRARSRANKESFEQIEGRLEQAIKEAPKDSELYMLLGEVLKEKHYTLSHAAGSHGKQPGFLIPPARIRVLLEKAIALDPGNRRAYWIMANYCTAANKPEEAIKHYRKMQKLDPRDLSVDLQIGVTYLAMEQYPKAKTQLDMVWKKAQGGTDGNLKQKILDSMARLAMKQGKHDDAEKYFLQAMNAGGDPANCSYHALGELYAGLGKFKKGARFVMKAAELEPERGDIQLRAAVLSFLAYDFKSSRKYCDRIIDRSPGNLSRTFNISGYLLLLEKKYDRAREAFDSVLKVDALDSGANVGKGHLALIEKNYQSAQSLLKSHAASLPPSTELQGYPYLVFKMASLGMAWLMSNQAKHAEAIRYFDKILTRTETDLFALLGKGSSLTALGQLKDARDAFKKVLELDPGNQYGLAELGLVKLNSGDIEGAKEAFSKAKASGGQKYTCPYEGLGLVYLRQGKIAKARENFEKAIEINPNIEFKKFNELAKIYIKQGKTDKAISLLKKSIQNYPYDPEAKNLLQKLQGGGLGN